MWFFLVGSVIGCLPRKKVLLREQFVSLFFLVWGLGSLEGKKKLDNRKL